MESEEWRPPTALQAKGRLMVLWANSGRSFLEREYRDDVAAGDKFAAPLRKWTVGKLAPYLTTREMLRHEQPLGSWTDRQIVDDGWDTEAGAIVAWALKLVEETPVWDMPVTWEAIGTQFFRFPDPMRWRPSLQLRSPDEIEPLVMTYETIHWTIRERKGHERASDYEKKLLGRAKQLGHVELAPDGDLLVSDGCSLGELDDEQISTIRSISRERLEALNWLCGQDPDWDMITGDTIVGWLWDDNWKDADAARGSGAKKGWFGKVRRYWSSRIDSERRP